MLTKMADRPRSGERGYRRCLGWEPRYGTVGFDVETNRRLGLLFPWLTGDHWLCLGPVLFFLGGPLPRQPRCRRPNRLRRPAPRRLPTHLHPRRIRGDVRLEERPGEG